MRAPALKKSKTKFLVYTRWESYINPDWKYGIHFIRKYLEQNVLNKWKESYYTAVFTNRKHIFPFLGRLQYIQCAVWVFIWAAVVAVASAKQSAWHQTQAFWVQFLEGFGMSDGDSDLALKCAILPAGSKESWSYTWLRKELSHWTLQLLVCNQTEEMPFSSRLRRFVKPTSTCRVPLSGVQDQDGVGVGGGVGHLCLQHHPMDSLLLPPMQVKLWSHLFIRSVSPQSKAFFLVEV